MPQSLRDYSYFFLHRHSCVSIAGNAHASYSMDDAVSHFSHLMLERRQLWLEYVIRAVDTRDQVKEWNPYRLNNRLSMVRKVVDSK
jgi:hypothetical protein